jgi:hypothetical protein
MQTPRPGTLPLLRPWALAAIPFLAFSPSSCRRAPALYHRAPEPRGGFPPLAGITACSGSHNCPPRTVCCLHQIGMAEVQAIVCHADLDECRDHAESCNGTPGDCRTPHTKCSEYTCSEP